ALAERHDVIQAVRQPQSGAFFQQNAFLFLPTERLAHVTDGLTQAAPLLDTLISDPSLRGVLDALGLGLMGVERKELTLDAMKRPLNDASDTVEHLLAGQSTSFSWRLLAS